VTFAPCWSGLSANGLSSCSANLASARVSAGSMPWRRCWRS
jgi:hypothetical protein